MSMGLTKNMSPEQYDRLKYFDLENYETVRGTYTEDSTSKKETEKKFGINRKNQQKEALRVIF